MNALIKPHGFSYNRYKDLPPINRLLGLVADNGYQVVVNDGRTTIEGCPIGIFYNVDGYILDFASERLSSVGLKDAFDLIISHPVISGFKEFREKQ